MKADTGGAIRVEAAERKLSVTGGKHAKRAADTDPEALEYDAAQPERAAVSQEDTQMMPAAASSSSSNSRQVAAPVAAPRPVAAPVAAPAAVAAPVAAPATVAVPVTAPMTVAAPVAAPATAAGPESAPWHAATAADPYGPHPGRSLGGAGLQIQGRANGDPKMGNGDRASSARGRDLLAAEGDEDGAPIRPHAWHGV